MPVFCATLLCVTVPGAEERAWSKSMIGQPELWATRMNDAEVSNQDGGLRVEVAPDREWAIAAAEKVLLPENVGVISVRVREISPSGKWLMRLWGDVRGHGRPKTASIAERETRIGEVVFEPDPRTLRMPHRPPVQVQLGIEGKPGDYVVFEALEFAPAKPRPPATEAPGQIALETVDLMPNLPQPYKMLDWRAKAEAYDRFVFDWDAKGKHLPLIWLDDGRVNIDRPTFGLPSYVGDTRLQGSNQESITAMGAVLGATVAGIDKRTQEHDYVLMCESFFNRKNGSNLVLNHQNQGTGGSFWYELFPHIVFYALADLYPGVGERDAIVRITANRWADAVEAMDGNFDHTAFNFATMKPVDNGRWKEPDAAAGIGWLEYAAWRKFGDEQHLRAADRCFEFLDACTENPYYENLLPWGTLTAVRMNAELGRRWDTRQLMEWCFGLSDCRGGWAVTVQNWGGYDCAGLLGSVDNEGGYAFAMNTFTQAAALVPVARYDTRYARALGKWMLNLANAARLFYPNELPEDHQCCGDWKGDPEGVIAYEGLRRQVGDKSPFATGDPVRLNWGPKTDLGLYGSSYVGLLGGIVEATDVEAILRLDCLATDFHRAPAYPTYLIYNPYAEAKQATLDVGADLCDVYDAVTDRWLAQGKRRAARIEVPADRAIVAVVVPAGGEPRKERGRTLWNGIVIDYGDAGT